MIRENSSLYQTFVKTRDPADFSVFKKYRNFVTKCLQIAKNTYFENHFTAACSRSDLVWREINKLIKPDVTSREDLGVTLDAKTYTGKELANKFKEYFTSLAVSRHDGGQFRL